MDYLEDVTVTTVATGVAEVEVILEAAVVEVAPGFPNIPLTAVTTVLVILWASDPEVDAPPGATEKWFLYLRNTTCYFLCTYMNIFHSGDKYELYK